MTTRPGTTTSLLNLAAAGDQAAADELWSMLYDELLVLARRRLSCEPRRMVLNAHGLVHEVYLRLFGKGPARWANRQQFFAFARRAMWQICTDEARRRHRDKRGSGRPDLPLEPDAADVFRMTLDQILDLEHALERMAHALGRRRLDVVRLRFIEGWTENETASMLGVSRRTVQEDWKAARSWLQGELGGESGADGAPECSGD